MNVLVVGAGIGGLTLALELHQAGIPCRVLEAVPRIQPIGAGINLLPHAVRGLARLDVADGLEAAGVETRESVFFNRFGQLVYREPVGRHAGYTQPQISIHRGDAQLGLLAAVRERLGDGAVELGRRVTAVADREDHVQVTVTDAATGATSTERADVVVACDGIHSAVRAQFYPDEGEPRYSGITMWRGVTPWPSFLTGASMVRAGWLASGKMVVYPVRDADESGNQLVNWVAEVERPQRVSRDWTRSGRLDDFIDVFADWRFDWLDVPGLIQGADTILEYPMVDQDPLPRWTFGAVTLLGDAAHPMVPRGSNGAGQAVLDAHALRRALTNNPGDPRAALRHYEAERLPATTSVVTTNRVRPPDTILKEVYERTGDRPFDRIEDVISTEEMAAISDGYKKVAAYDKDLVNRQE
ncbi:flavin-dependent oxidoreductase [Streptomyces sp. NBRC 109706]|uniref:flavin-dependent oxidoreductase n=1 Tax=Streptomyces sp. NBRC 109706 TaxID=1550035 RepID=UPI0007815333|nr:flavin-dependent oxidoreductase [Streptomyces sp. NBRC 109706]